MATVHTFADELHDTTQTTDTEATAGEVLTGPGFTVAAVCGAVAGAVAGTALGADLGSSYPGPCGTLGTMLGSALAAAGWWAVASAARAVRRGLAGRG